MEEISLAFIGKTEVNNNSHHIWLETLRCVACYANIVCDHQIKFRCKLRRSLVLFFPSKLMLVTYVVGLGPVNKNEIHKYSKLNKKYIPMNDDWISVGKNKKNALQWQ